MDGFGQIQVFIKKDTVGENVYEAFKLIDIGEFLVRPILIKSIAIIKKAAAIVHGKEKQILPKIDNKRDGFYAAKIRFR